MTVEPTTSTLSLRRLSSIDDLAGVASLMTGYVDEIRRNLRDRHGVALDAATPDADLLVEIAGLLEPPQCLYLTLWGGSVLDEKNDTDDALAIRAVNDRIAADPRVRVVLLPIGDGLTIAQRL